jgi:hypothetical protein
VLGTRLLICPERLNKVAIARYVLIAVKPVAGSAFFEPITNEVKRGSLLVRPKCRNQIPVRRT